MTSTCDSAFINTGDFIIIGGTKIFWY